MKKNIYLSSILFFTALYTNAQILGGGTNFSNAVVFNNAWLTSCPSGAQTLSNVATFEPTVPIDACAPVPSITCVPASSISASDVWFTFYATKSTAKIVVAPTSAFNIVLQAFSGSACPGLTDIGCANALGNNGSETLNLIGLVVNQLYYFRIFGIGNNAGTRTGPYTFCGTTDLGSVVVPLLFSNFYVNEKEGKATLHWTTNTEINNDYFEIEKSDNGNVFFSIGRIKSLNTTTQNASYTFIDEDLFSSKVFYRIKQVDVDGKYTYSSIVNFKRKVNDNTFMHIFPNPIQDKICIKLKTKTNNTASSLKIINEYGQVVHEQNIKIVMGENEFTVAKPATLKKGIYTVQILMPSEKFTKQFVCL